MVRRDPTETGGTYYRIMPEGRYDGYDGFTLKIKRPLQGLDLNRNFPASWRQEFEQQGAGPYPTSEPEIRAVVDFVVRHPNICGGTSFHTWSGVLLRPFEHQSDDEMDAEDLWFYQAAGHKGTELTGYPAISVYHEFRYHPKSVIGGTFDWIYEHLGVFSWVVEIWSPMREAGIENYKYIDWFRDHAIEDDLNLFRWSEQKLGGSAHHRLEALRSSATRQARDRRLGPLPCVRQSTAAAARARDRALSALVALAGAVLAEARARACGRCRARRRHVEGDAGDPEHGLAADLCVEARAGAQDRARRRRGSRAASWGEPCVRQAARRCRPARRQSPQAHRRVVLAGLQRHRRPDED